VNNNATGLKGQQTVKIDPFTPFYIRLSIGMVRAIEQQDHRGWRLFAECFFDGQQRK
jgi:hypothetical protein